MGMPRIFALALLVAFLRGALADGIERADVVRDIPLQTSFSVAGTNVFTVGRFTIDEPFGLRPWRVRYSFRYRSCGSVRDLLQIHTRAVFAGGVRTDDLTPVVRNMNWDARTTYRCNASEDWKQVDTEVDFKTELPPAVHVICKGIEPCGVVEFDSFKVSVVYRPMHRLSGGEFSLANGALLRHVFFADSGKICVELADPDNLLAAEAVLRDETGKELSRKPIKAVDSVVLPSRGYYGFDIAARYADGSKITTSASAAVLGPEIPEESRKKSRFGAMIVNGGASRFTRKIGGRWDWRFFFYDRDNSQYVGSSYGEDVIYAGHVHPVFKSAAKPADAGRNGYFPPGDWDEQRRCLRRFFEKNPCFDARRLCLVNEPDIKWRGSIPELVQLHRLFSEEAHRLYPGVEVHGPACSRINTQLLRDMGRAGLYECVDAVNLHAYVDGTSPESDFRRLLKEGLGIVRNEFNCKKPVYITEFGWTTEDGTWQMPVSELAQARYLTRSFAFIAAEDIQAAVWFCDFYVARNYGEGGFSILRRGNACVSPKPAAAAFMALSRNLANLKGRLKICQTGPKEWIASGRRDDGICVSLVWTSQGEREMDLPVPVDRAEDFLGRPIRLGSRIKISESPVYLFGPEAYRGGEWHPEELPDEEIAVAEDEYPVEMTGVGWRCRDNLLVSPVPDKCWNSLTGDVPVVKVAYSTEGLILNVDVDDSQHSQPYSQERLIEGDSVTVAVDIDKAMEWQPNAHTTSFKGHRCYEYTVALRDDGKKDAYRRNAWDFDMKSNVPAGPLVCTGVNKLKNGKTRYMVWLRWRVIGLMEMPRPGDKIGLAVLVSDLSGGKRKEYELFGKISGIPNPMKYGTFKFMPLKKSAFKQER